MLPAHNYKSILTDWFLTDLQSSRRGHPSAHTTLTLLLCQGSAGNTGMRRAMNSLLHLQTNKQLINSWSPGLMTGYTGYLCRSPSTPRRGWAALNKVWVTPGMEELPQQCPGSPEQPSTGGDWVQVGNEELLLKTRQLQPSLLRSQQRLRGRTRVQVWVWHLWAQPCQVPLLLQRQNRAPSLLGKDCTRYTSDTENMNYLNINPRNLKK